jgi:Mrp family chromosome partitioning ATPase/uncharacterized protein involved in exopolysaccharide biosynthesis
LNAQSNQIHREQEPAQVGNPMLSQIREFIDAGNEPAAALDPLGILRRSLRGRELRIALVMLLVALLGAFGAYTAISPAYQSSGMVRVLAREAKILYSDSDDSRLRLYDAFVTAEMELLKSRPVLEAALADLHSRANTGFPVPGDVGDLAGMFNTVSKKGLISIAARSPYPELSAAAVNAVLNAYEAGNEAARRRHFDVRRSELSARERELHESLVALNDEYLATGGEHDAGTLSKAHIAKTAQLEVLEERIAELDNTIAQMQTTGGVGADVGSVEIQRATLLDKATADMTYERAQRLAALETLKRRYRPSHPKLRAAEGELAILEAAIDERREQIATLGKAGALTGGNSASAEQSISDLEMLRSKLESRRETIRTEASELNSKIIRIRGIVTEKDRVEELLAETKRALDEVLVESQNDLTRSVEIVAFGKVPDGPIEDKRKPAALGAAVFGSLGALSCFVLLTVVGGRVRFSDDLDARASSLLGTVIADADQGGGEMDEAARRLRNELDLRWPSSPKRSRVIGFVATSGDAGATSLVSALGRHYAAAGRRVLLIDANSAVCGIRRLAMAGPAAYARDSVTLADAIGRSPVASGSLELLETGSAMSRDQDGRDSAELSFEEMRGMLDAAREEHDVVLVDLGVLEAGSQAAVGSALSDRVIVVARGGESKQRINTKLDLLDRLAPKRQLLVLNRMPGHDPQLAAGPAVAKDLATHAAWLKNHLNFRTGVKK